MAPTPSSPAAARSRKASRLLLTEIPSDHLLPITKNAVELGTHEWISDLPQGPEGQAVLHLIFDRGHAIRFLEAMRVHPELIWPPQLLIHKGAVYLQARSWHASTLI